MTFWRFAATCEFVEGIWRASVALQSGTCLSTWSCLAVRPTFTIAPILFRIHSCPRGARLTRACCTVSSHREAGGALSGTSLGTCGAQGYRCPPPTPVKCFSMSTVHIPNALRRWAAYTFPTYYKFFVTRPCVEECVAATPTRRCASSP